MTRFAALALLLALVGCSSSSSCPPGYVASGSLCLVADGGGTDGGGLDAPMSDASTDAGAMVDTNPDSGVADVTARCLAFCMRRNTVCSRTDDCAGTCASPDATTIARDCASEYVTFDDCSVATPDAMLCTVGQPGAACATEFGAVLSCVQAHTPDSGVVGDAG